MFKLSFKGVNFLFTISYFIFFIIVIFILYNIYNHNKIIIINLGTIFKISNYIEIPLIFIIDYISIVFCFLIIFISLLVLIYSKDYFKLEPELNRFTNLLIFFSLSMIMLVISSHFIIFFFFWELIGISSFFLINFYYYKINVWKASYKAFFFNKISDSFILIGSFLFFFDGIEFITFFPNSLQYNFNLYLATIFFVLGASIKSSQLGFHVWLPDSMEAPVPASSLIHSATLVSAGVYVLLRLHNLLILLNNFYIFLYIWFSFTALYGGVVAMYQDDIKKLLAYSTISHCGFLFISSLNINFEQTIIYLILHGVFKAISFMLAGRFIQILQTQDLRYWGQVVRFLPIETVILLFSVFNLAALPCSMGLYYKNLFFAVIFNKYVNFFIISINFIGCLSGLGYFLHIFKAIFSKELKFKPIIIDNKFYLSSSGNMWFIFTSSIVFVYLINIYYFNNYIFYETIYYNNLFIIKLFYSFVMAIIIIYNFLDIKKDKVFYFNWLQFFIWAVISLTINCL